MAMRMDGEMAKVTSQSVEQEAAERMARLGMPSGVSGHKVAVPPAPVVPVVVEAEPSVSKKGKDQRLCIIVSREQALKIKRYALENDTTVSDLLRGFIDSL